VGIADILRLYCAGGSLALVVLCIYSLYAAPTLDQRIRFGSLALFGVVITSGQIANLGQPGTWRMPLLAVAVTAATVGTAMFVGADVRARTGR
jgi:hypothetical protein